MKANRILGFFWLIIAVFLTVILAVKLTGKSSREHPRFSFIPTLGNNLESSSCSGLYKTLDFPAMDINDIDVGLSSESIYVEKTSEPEISVELYCSEQDEPKAYVNGNVLKIEDSKNKRIPSMGIRKVVIKIPEGHELNNIDLNSASGSIHCSDITAESLDSHSFSGSTQFYNCKIESLDIKSTNGSIKLNDCNVSELDCNVTSGSIKIDGSYDAIEAKSVSGSISVDLSAPIKQSSSFQTTSGSIKLNVKKDSNMKIKYSVTSGSYRNEISGTKGKKGYDSIGNEGPYVELKTTSGSILVQ